MRYTSLTHFLERNPFLYSSVKVAKNMIWYVFLVKVEPPRRHMHLLLGFPTGGYVVLPSPNICVAYK